jgi:hypothetical protein
VASKNPYGRTVKPEQAHFVYQSFDGSWTWYVLKTYQTPEKEAQNPYARWFCAVSSPFLHPPLAGGKNKVQLEYGDVYVAEIKRQARKLEYNPLCIDKQTGGQDEQAS